MSTTDYRPPPSVSALFKSETEGERILRLGREMREAAEARGQTLTRTADRLASVAERQRAKAVVERQRRVLKADAQERKEDDAYERAMDIIDKGGQPDAETMALALRSRERRGLGPKVSSAEQHAADYLSRGQADNSADIEFEV